MKGIIFLLLLIGTLAHNAKTQSLAAYQNNANFFMVFEEGIERKVEYLPVKEFKVGFDKVAYVDNINNFKVYYKGETYRLEEMPVNEYVMGNGLLTYLVAGVLKVLEEDGPQIIGMRVEDFEANDSIVAYYDLNTYMFGVYYNGKKKPLENIISSGSFRNFKTGRNLVAYFSPVGDLRVFYQNKIYDLLYNVTAVNYKAGKNVVAFTDPNTREFKVFYKGTVMDLEYVLPKSFDVGDNRVAYIDNMGNFKCFENGEVKTILSYEPDYYELTEGVLLYNDQQRLNVFYDGGIKFLEYYFPKVYQIVNNRLAYLDQMGGVKLFENGAAIQVTTNKVLGFDLNPNTVSYRVWNNSHQVFFEGQTY